MEKYNILFIDSGIGGLSTLAEIIKNTTGKFLYYADNIHCPYGNHNKNEIYNYLKNIIISLKSKYKIKIVVLACNTATTSSIDKLRHKFKDIIFIGIEPAILLAYKLKYKKILCIATPTTLKQNKYNKLIKSINIKVKSLPLNNFASSIEEYLTLKTFKSRLNIIKEIYYIKSKCKNYDSIVLGCTHYILIKDLIQKHINLPLIDGNYGVMKNIKKYHINNEYKKNKIKFFLSYNSNDLIQKYIKILKQILAK